MAKRKLVWEGSNNQLDAYWTRVARAKGWNPTIPDPANPGQTIPNPVTFMQFATAAVHAYTDELAEMVHVREGLSAAEPTARNLAKAERDAIARTTENA